MSLTAILAYIIALGIAAGIPGPGIAALVGRALGSGFGKTMPMLLGLAVGDVVYLALAVGGLAVIANVFSGVFFVIKIAGAAYLLWLAWQFWSKGIQTQKVNALQGKTKSDWRAAIGAFTAGLTVTLGNPKTIVFYMAILPAVMDLQQVTLHGFLILVVLTFVVLFVVLTPYVAIAARIRNSLDNKAQLDRLGKAAAIILTGTAGWIMARG